MDVLVLLARRAGEVVSKEEFFAAVWPDLAIEEGALSQCIHAIRKALGDDARQPRFVETVPRRGYRLIADVSWLEAKSVVETVSVPLWRRWKTGIVVLGLAAGLILAGLRSRANVRIMVLPFEASSCLSGETSRIPGFVEQVRRELEGAVGLDMISSTTSASVWESGLRVPSEISREVNVDYLLLGSFVCHVPTSQPESVSVELVRAREDVRAWSGSFQPDDLDATNQIAQHVARRLGLALSRPGYAPQDEQASTAFQHGLAEVSRLEYDDERLRAAVAYFEDAIHLDPDYVPAWAELVQAHTLLYLNSDRSPARADRAYRTLQRALDRGYADEPEIRLAKAYYLYRVAQDYRGALAEFNLAGSSSTIRGRVFEGKGYTYRRLGDLDKALEFLQQALALDSRNESLLAMIAETYRAQRRYEQADVWFHRTLTLNPGLAHLWGEKALNRLAGGASVQVAQQILDQATVENQASLRFYRLILDLFEGSTQEIPTDAYRRALARFGTRPQEVAQADDFSSDEAFDRFRLPWRKVLLHELLGQPEAARAQAEHNLAALDFEAQRNTRYMFLPAYRGIALAQLGRCNEALGAANRALELAAQDHFSGARVLGAKAVVLTLCGDSDAAVEVLAELLKQNYQFSLCLRFLELDPVWRPLRTHPKFVQLLAP